MRIIALLLLISVLPLTACSQKRSAEDVLTRYCEEHPIDQQIYSSLADEYDTGHIDREMLTSLYGDEEYPVRELALVFYGKVDTVREIGVFITSGGDDVIRASEIAAARIRFLSGFSRGEGFIKKYRGVLVYGFVEDASYTEEIFDRIL